MATLALSIVGQTVGNMILPGIGGAIGRAVGAIGGAWIDSNLISQTGQETTVNAPKISSLTVTSSADGDNMPRLYGRSKLGGNIIWATYHEVEVVPASSGGGKGLGSSSSASTQTTYAYYANFAVGLCEGEITRIGRVWADGKEVVLTEYTHRVYTGTATQLPDSLIEAKEGAGNAPAYRGLAYIVFERLALKSFGNRVPQLAFEVFRAVDTFENEVRAVAMIPAAGEFAYYPGEVRVDNGGGATFSENRHTNLGVSDWAVAADQLRQGLPNAAAVSLFVAWFGSDLRCANCTIKPKVDSADKNTTPVGWGVSGLTRATAEVVSTSGLRVAYGGTPSDNSVVAAIQDLHARGYQVIYTPFLLMDVPAGNTLPDPYTGVGTQPVYPWRGRITCSPAPGQPSTPDKTAAAATQIAAFYGTAVAADFTIGAGTVTYTGPTEWTFSRHVLHSAALAAAAGGVEAFVIGSEMRGVGWVRDSASTYPFVAKLQALAAQVAILLPAAKLTYAADWSEYFGHHPGDGSGDVYFHLDPLWSDANIDAVAIDNYWPLADWRDGTEHLDYGAGYRFIHDLNYLQSNIAGGEGYEWYYADDAARESQTRTAITDGAGKPWVFRYKDIRNWWLNAHYNRPAGTESGSPTGWAAQSKPIWFTELGCPAIDKGSNQPNVFFDPKSSESFFPYFSRGTRDDLVQRRHLRAFLEWYAVGANNPTSSVYGLPMVDTARIVIYTWDARPYPAFPAYTSIWSDGDNWRLGHWLTGRISDAPLAEAVEKMMADFGFSEFNAGALSGSMAGYVIDSVCSARDALQPLETAFFFDAFESQGSIRFGHRGHSGNVATVTPDELVETTAHGSTRTNLTGGNQESPRYQLTRAQETDLPRSVKISFIDPDQDYKQASAEGRRIAGASGRVSSARLPLVTSYGAGRAIAETMLQEAWAARERATFTLPPSCLAVDASDVVTLASGGRSLPLRLTGLHLGDGGVACEAMSIEARLYDAFGAPERDMPAAVPATFGTQAAAFLDLPLIRGDEVACAGSVAAFGSPWPGGVAFYRSPTTSGYELIALASQPATMGVTAWDFYSGPTGRWDRGNMVQVTLGGGQLASAADLLVLGGANLAAIQNADGDWEVLQFATAKFISAGVYNLSNFLRGQFGTEAAIRNPVAAGAPFVLLDAAVIQVDMTAADIGLAYNWKYGPAPYDIGNAAYSTLLAYAFRGVGLRPLSPCQVKGAFVSGDLAVTWKRRTRISGDSWEQVEVPLSEDSETYEVDVMDGATVKRTISATTPAATYTAAQQTADWGAPQASYTVRVYQMSASYGRGAVASVTVP